MSTSISSLNINNINKNFNNSDNLNKNKIGETIYNEYVSMKSNYDTTPNNKGKKLTHQNEDQINSPEKISITNCSIHRTSSSNLYASQNKKYFYHIGDKLLRNIKDMNKEISRSYFFTNNIDMKCISDILNCRNNDECKDSYKDGQKVDNLNTIKNEKINIHKDNDNLINFENDEKKRVENNIYKNTYYFYEISNKIIQKSDNFKGNSKIKKYFPYVLKTSFISLNFLKQANIINIYIKYMYLYEYLYHMILNRILHISTVNSFPFLQNVILKDLSYYFEDFKKSKIKNFWKFYLYLHTLIDMNKNNIYLISKLFHNNAIDYFIKLFYSLSFYNSIFSVLFLKMMEVIYILMQNIHAFFFLYS